MNIYDQASRLLKILKMDPIDPYNNDLATSVMEHFGGLDAVLKELAHERYNRVRYTPEIMLNALIDKKQDRDPSLDELAKKIYALRTSIMDDALKDGEPFEELLSRVNVIQSLGLTQREAWIIHFCGGKRFISELNRHRDGDSVMEIIAMAAAKADKHLSGSAALPNTKAQLYISDKQR